MQFKQHKNFKYWKMKREWYSEVDVEETKIKSEQEKLKQTKNCILEHRQQQYIKAVSFYLFRL